MKRLFFLLFITFLISCNSEKDYITLQVHIEGIRFDSLLLGGGNITGDQAFKIYGESADGHNWKFLIPDSVSRSALTFMLMPKIQGETANIKHLVDFSTLHYGDTLNYDKLPFDYKIRNIYAKFLDTRVQENIPMVNLIGTNEIYYATLHRHRFEIPLYKDSEFEVLAYHKMFPYSPTYEIDITQCIEIIEKYPDSRYLMGCIVQTTTAFETRENLQKIFSGFSKENQQSDFGKIIDNYLKTFFVFSNMELPKYDTDNLELIVQDSSKMNLIVFSASWCRPCHEQIPILKEIYHDLNDCLDITYISMDDEKSADYWRKLMIEEEIPWRSLMAKGDNRKTVQATYNPRGTIPFTLLVYPNRDMEIVDVRKNEQREKLYSLCGK